MPNLSEGNGGVPYCRR